MDIELKYIRHPEQHQMLLLKMPSFSHLFIILLKFISSVYLLLLNLIFVILFLPGDTSNLLTLKFLKDDPSYKGYQKPTPINENTRLELYNLKMKTQNTSFFFAIRMYLFLSIKNEKGLLSTPHKFSILFYCPISTRVS